MVHLNPWRPLAAEGRSRRRWLGFKLFARLLVALGIFRLPVRWKGGDGVKSGQPIRVRVNYHGLRLEDARVYAVYVEPMP